MVRHKRNSSLDFSIIIAILAVLISTITAFISYKESKILKEQQIALTSQQEASVWPYLQNNTFIEFQGDSMINFSYQVINKGVGPAIIETVKYFFDEKEIDQGQLYQAIREKYGKFVTVYQTQNHSLSNTVLASGDNHKLITEQLYQKDDDVDLNGIANEISRLFKLEYCYCSVYGKCWKVMGREISNNNTCSIREEIR